MIHTASNTYSPLAKILHWISAVVIIWSSITGTYVSFSANLELQALIAHINVSITSLLIPIFAVRIVYRLCRSGPAPLSGRPLEQLAARIGHFLLYGLTTTVLISGVLMMTQSIQIFDWFSLPQPLEDQVLNRLFDKVHKVTCRALAVMIVVHLAAVVRHQYFGRPVLQRMI
ncbi:MAG: cytochrome b/b6 domain-containing protein [Amphritea sp.]